MNDFTKEELLALLNIIKHGAILPTDVIDCIANKIQTLIDNYCKHECNGEVEIFVDTCNKCEAYLLRETHHE